MRHFTRKGNTTFLFVVAESMEPERCACSHGQACNKVAGTFLQNIHRRELFANILQILVVTGEMWNRLQVLSCNGFDDVG